MELDNFILNHWTKMVRTRCNHSRVFLQQHSALALPELQSPAFFGGWSILEFEIGILSEGLVYWRNDLLLFILALTPGHRSGPAAGIFQWSSSKILSVTY